jgi:hypothetical protein
MLRHLLPPLLIAATITGAYAQQRGAQREDLLDKLMTHIQLCTEITDNNGRLACFDRLQTRLGDVPPTNAPPAPTPLRPGGAPPATGPTAPNLTTPGGGVATLGGPQGNPNVQANPSPLGQPQDPDRAFDPRASTYRPPESIGPKPQPVLRRTGPRPLPNFGRPMPLVTLEASNLTYGEARYWQVSMSVTSNTNRTVDAQVQCTFMNAGKPVEDVYFGPVPLQPGEQISTELVGPPTTAYVDTTNCRVLSPL